MAASKTFKLALVQLAVGADKAVNVRRAVEKVREAAAAGAQLIALPECFNSPYGSSYFPEYAEPLESGDTYKAMSDVARETSTYVIGGSIPERTKGGKLFNTCAVFNDNGVCIGKHRKVHLFDIDVPGKITFKESETLTAGDCVTVVDTPWCKVGLAICYDIRFPLFTQICRDRGVKFMCYPGAFNMTTGPAHWELLLRARALDNQLWAAAVSPARDETASYVAWGHSTVVDPWGSVAATTEHGEDIVYADVDTARADEVRQNIPVLQQQRFDIYGLDDKKHYMTAC